MRHRSFGDASDYMTTSYIIVPFTFAFSNVSQIMFYSRIACYMSSQIQFLLNFIQILKESNLQSFNFTFSFFLINMTFCVLQLGKRVIGKIFVPAVECGENYTVRSLVTIHTESPRLLLLNMESEYCTVHVSTCSLLGLQSETEKLYFFMGPCWVPLLVTFAKLRKATISFVMSLCPSVRPSARREKLCSHWTDFDKT